MTKPARREDGKRHTEASLFVLNSRFEELGYRCMIALDYDLSEGQFKAAEHKMAHE